MAEGEERWRKYIDPDGVARIPDDEFRGLLARFEEVQRQYEELEGDYALRLSHLMAEEEHAKGLRADLERAQESLRGFLDWYDSRFPTGQSKQLPGVTLFTIATKAREALAEAREREPYGLLEGHELIEAEAQARNRVRERGEQ